MSRVHQLKISVSGIRGVVGEFLTPNLACAFAQAFGTYVGPGPVVIGRDTRSSGEMIEHAVTCGLLAAGCEVVKAGIAPTPTIQVHVAEIHARGGIAVTASHNPPEYNALKLFNREGLFFNHYERSELLDLYHQSQFRQAANDEIRRVVTDTASAPQRHIARVLAHVDVDRIRARGFRVALDGVNGAGSLMSVHFLREVLGCELHAISVDPSQPFPREAEPRAEVLGELQALIRQTGADAAFAQDPDGDRLAVGDETGRILDNDDVLALAVDCALRRRKGPVVVNLTTSAVIDDIAARHGCAVFRAPVGEANVVERMKAAGAIIGGEGSNGGIIFPVVQYCRDSYMGMAFLLDRMAETGQTMSELAATLPAYHRRLGKLPFEHGRLGQMMQALERTFPGAQVDRSDGLKLTLPGGWIHLRASNTEPILRVAAEARTQEQLEELYAKASSVA
ncbi:MAG: phosphoglucosamine mutase [Candidatus Solibacter usitatus]|nr:phosphoglucosamine mutase [Candidatus Solibacter usitatus]